MPFNNLTISLLQLVGILLPVVVLTYRVSFFDRGRISRSTEKPISMEQHAEKASYATVISAGSLILTAILVLLVPLFSITPALSALPNILAVLLLIAFSAYFYLLYLWFVEMQSEIDSEVT